MKNKVLYAYDENGKYVRSFRTPAITKAFLKVDDISHIYKAISGKRANAFGYKWSKVRYRDVVKAKKKDFCYVVVDVVTGKERHRADTFDDVATFFRCKPFQLRKGIASSDRKLFRQRFRLDKESKHKL